MKKIITAIALSLAFFILPACNSDKKDKKEKALSASEVPAPVQTAFSEKYSTATDIKWEDAHENNEETYKAKFMADGKKWKAEFDANGTLVKEGEDK